MDIKVLFGKKKNNAENIEKQKLNVNEGKNAGKFLEVICKRCGNKQVVYGKSTTDVKCLKCNKLLVKTGGGKAKIVTFIRRVLIWK